MEQERRQNQPQQPQAPLQCPRCHSINTKFRYFNNYNISQPRHYCKDCKRMWTVGGSLRNIPVGGTTWNKKKEAPSRSDDSSSQIQPPQLPTFPQNFDAMGNHLVTNFQEPVAPLHSFHFNNEFANLGAVDSPIQSEVINQAVNVRNQVSFDSSSVNFMQGWNGQYLEPKQEFSQQIQGYNDQSNVVNTGFAKFSQIHDEAGSSYNLPNHNLVQSTWPLDFTPQNAMNSFSFSTTADCLWDNFSSNTTNMVLPSTSADPNQWSEFPGYGPVWSQFPGYGPV